MRWYIKFQTLNYYKRSANIKLLNPSSNGENLTLIINIVIAANCDYATIRTETWLNLYIFLQYTVVMNDYEAISGVSKVLYSMWWWAHPIPS